MKWRMLRLISFLFALPSLSFAQTPTVERQVSGTPNTNINAGIFATVRNNCTSGPLPAVRLVTPPAHGQVTVKQGRLRATNLKQCLAMELPAFIAFYRPAADFIGQDDFVLEVTSAGGKPQLQRIIVTVAKPAAGQGI